MEHRCPECGAQLQPGEDCQTFFESLLFEEYANPARNYEAHHLMVLSFMLTHDRYSDEARPQAIALLRTALEGNPPSRYLRRVTEQLFGQDTPRQGSILRGDDRPTRAIDWPVTMRDVALRPEDDYPTRITGWARSVLETLEARGA